MGIQCAYSKLKEELAEHFLVSAEKFMAENGYGTLDRESLGQMEGNLLDVAGEILIFGFDVWPVETLLEVEGA